MSEPETDPSTNGHDHAHDDKEEVCPACYLNRALNELTGDCYVALADFFAGSNENLLAVIKGTLTQVFDFVDDVELKPLLDRVNTIRDNLQAKRDKDAKAYFASQMEDAETLRAFVTKAAGGTSGTLTEETAFKILACVGIDPDATPTESPLQAGLTAAQGFIERYLVSKAEAVAQQPTRVPVELVRPIPMPGVGGWDGEAKLPDDMPEIVSALVELRRLGLIDQYGTLSVNVRAAMMLHIQQEMNAKAAEAKAAAEVKPEPEPEVGSGG